MSWSGDWQHYMFAASSSLFVFLHEFLGHRGRRFKKLSIMATEALCGMLAVLCLKKQEEIRIKDTFLGVLRRTGRAVNPSRRTRGNKRVNMPRTVSLS